MSNGISGRVSSDSSEEEAPGMDHIARKIEPGRSWDRSMNADA